MGGNGWFVTAVFGWGAALAVAMMIGAIGQSDGRSLVVGAIMLLAVSPGLILIGLGLRPLVLTETSLKLPTFRGADQIPLARISGVGLIYNRTPYTRSPSGWSLYVWDGESPKRVQKWTVTTGAAPLASGTRRKLISVPQLDWTMPLAHENGAYLASTGAGKVAARIYQAVLTVQGPTGPLSTVALQKAVSFSEQARPQLAAWWSPDGTMGRAAGLPPVDPAKVDLASVLGLSASRLASLVGFLAAFGGLFTGGIVYASLAPNPCGCRGTDVGSPHAGLIAFIAGVLTFAVGLYVAFRLADRRRTLLEIANSG